MFNVPCTPPKDGEGGRGKRTATRGKGYVTVQKLLKEWRQELEKGAAENEKPGANSLPNAHMSVADYVTNYINVLESAGSVRPSAISDYRTSAKRISEGVGNVQLKELTPGMIQDWEAGLLKGGKKYITTPKTEAGKRCIPIHPVLSSTLTQLGAT